MQTFDENNPNHIVYTTDGINASTRIESTYSSGYIISACLTNGPNLIKTYIRTPNAEGDPAIADPITDPANRYRLM